MKAVQVAVLLLCINAGFFIVSAADVWRGGDVGGATPQDVENKVSMENNRVAGRLPSRLSMFIDNKVTIGIIIIGIIIGGMSTLAARVTTPQVVGILAFSIIYSVLLANQFHLLDAMMLPEYLITVITGFQYFWLAAAIIQMATGTSWKVLQ